MNKATDEERAALERLISHTKKETGQARRVADFLLAWWNPSSCGGFPITAAWGFDEEILDDIFAVFALAVRCNVYPDSLGYGDQFEAIVYQWRPDLIKAE